MTISQMGAAKPNTICKKSEFKQTSIQKQITPREKAWKPVTRIFHLTWTSDALISPVEPEPVEHLHKLVPEDCIV